MSEPSAVPPYDLAFRPSSYWDLADPAAAILQDVKGQRRREVVRSHLATGLTYWPESWNEAMLSPTLPVPILQRLLAVDESWIGGERLPDCAPGEVEIARVVLTNRTRSVFSLRARRTDGTIHFRMLADDDVRPWKIAPSSASEPLSLAEVRDLILSASHPRWPADERALDDRLRHGMLRQRGGFFVRVESECYPGLDHLFGDRARQWAAQQPALGGPDA